jgi:hydrogenase nickel incorporation protein HypA/HybF
VSAVHEIGLCEGVLDAVERRAAGRRVRSVTVRAGALHRVVPESMETAFALVAAGTVADGAQVRLVLVPVQVRCRSCGLETEAADPLAVCSRCGGTDLDLSGGDELVLESLELAEQEAEVSGGVPGHPR